MVKSECSELFVQKVKSILAIVNGPYVPSWLTFLCNLFSGRGGTPL